MPSDESGGDTERFSMYRAVINFHLKRSMRVMRIESEWTYERDVAEMIVDYFAPYENGWDEAAEAFVEKRTRTSHQRSSETDTAHGGGDGDAE